MPPWRRASCSRDDLTVRNLRAFRPATRPQPPALRVYRAAGVCGAGRSRYPTYVEIFTEARGRTYWNGDCVGHDRLLQAKDKKKLVHDGDTGGDKHWRSCMPRCIDLQRRNGERFSCTPARIVLESFYAESACGQRTGLVGCKPVGSFFFGAGGCVAVINFRGTARSSSTHHVPVGRNPPTARPVRSSSNPPCRHPPWPRPAGRTPVSLSASRLLCPHSVDSVIPRTCHTLVRCNCRRPETTRQSGARPVRRRSPPRVAAGPRVFPVPA